MLGFADGIDAHASLVDGAWPAEAAGEQPIEVAVSEEAATEMRAAVGDELELTSRLDSSMVVAVRVAGIYHVDDPTDPFWWEDQQLLAGVSISERYRTIGPLLTTRANAFDHAGTGTVSFTWHAFPEFSQLGVDETSALRAHAFPHRVSIVRRGRDKRTPVAEKTNRTEKTNSKDKSRKHECTKTRKEER